MTETLNTGAAAPDESAAPEGHDAQMVEAFDAAQTIPETPAAEEAAPDRPDWLPEKFQSAEDMAKAYAELEKKLGADRKDAASDPATVTPEQAAEQLQAQNLDFQAFATEFQANGALSDASYQQLERIPIILVHSRWR